MQIEIKCKGSKFIDIKDLEDFQGNLKTLEKAEYNKLYKSIKKHGFTFPVFVWENKILDGHQRIFTIKRMLKEGFTIGNIPVVEIDAKDAKEAAEKLLLLNSHFAKFTDEGLYEYLNTYNLDITELTEDLNLPDFNLKKFVSAYAAEEPNGKRENIAEIYAVYVECRDERHQTEVLNTLNELGIECRALIS